MGFIEVAYALSQLLLFSVLARFGGQQLVATYGIGIQWYNLALFIPFVLRSIILHRLSDNTSRSTTVFRLLAVHFLLGLLPLLCYFIFQSVLLDLYGESYHDLEDVFIYMLMAALLSSMSGVLAQNMIATNRTVSLMFWRILRDFGMLVVIFFIGAEMTILDLCKIFLLFQSIYLGGLCLRIN